MKKRRLVRNLFLFSILFAISIFSIMTINASVTLNTPVTNTNYTTITFNCSKDALVSAPVNTTSMEIWYNVTGGTTGTRLGAIANTSADQKDFSGSISIEGLSDALTYNFTCLAVNSSATGNVSSVGVSSVGIDNTAPVVSISTDQSKAYQTKYVGLNWSCTDATAGVSSNTVTLTANGDAGCTISGTTSWATATGSQSLTLTQTQCAGLYTNSLSCTDTAGNSNTASSTFNIYYPEGGSVVIPNSNQVKTSIGTTSRTKLILWIFGGIIFLIVLIALSFFAISQSKRR